jgi:hypothetical protein
VISTKDYSIISLTYTLEEHGHNIRELEFQQKIDICDLLQMPTILSQLTSLSFTQSNVIKAKQDTSLNVLKTFRNLCSNLDIRNPKNKEELDVLLFGLKNSLVSLKLGNWATQERQVDDSPFRHCTLLEKISLCGGVSAIDFKAICRLGSLKELIIATKMELIWDEDFEEAFEQQEMISLQNLDLSCCSNFGNRGNGSMERHIMESRRKWFLAELESRRMERLRMERLRME